MNTASQNKGEGLPARDATTREASDLAFMRLALEEARKAGELGEVPIGGVVVHEGVVIACGHNRRELDADPSAHAEFTALLEASRVLGHWRLTGCTVYVTLEPCLMCAGLMHQSRIDRCVFGATDPKAGALGTLYAVHEDARLNHRFEVTSGVCEQESAALLQDFFKGLRADKDTRNQGESNGDKATQNTDPGSGAEEAV